MPKAKCPDCRVPLPYAAQRCVRCGWCTDEVDHDTERGPSAFTRIRSGRRPWIVAAGVLLIGVGLAWFGRVGLTERYGEFAAHNLPAAFTAFAPVETATGAFYFCARLVVKQEIPSSSVEMFPSITPENTRSLGDARYNVNAVLTENSATGEVIEHAFSCTVQYETGHWELEELTLE
jgi:hypothetical protein